MDKATSLTTKENLCFVSFDSTKNSPQLHMDMNFDFSSFVGFGIGGIGFMAIFLASQVNI